MPRTDGYRRLTDEPIRRTTGESFLDQVEDPRARRQFLPLLAGQHRPLHGPRGRSVRCSCGEPYLACPVAAQIRSLQATARADQSVGASHWFG